MSFKSRNDGNHQDKPVEEGILNQWELMQHQLAEAVVKENNFELNQLSVVGGIDISFVPNSETTACVALVVMKYPIFFAKKQEVIYGRSKIVEMEQPYVSSFLGFREVNFYKSMLDDLKRENPECMPQVILVDGNGVLHVRKCGSASHLGVVYDIPTIGVAKNLVVIPEMEILRDETHAHKIAKLEKQGDKFEITTAANEVLGMAVLTGTEAKKPVYVSVGHNCDLDTAVQIVLSCSPKYRVPEPIREADMLSREELRKKFPSELMKKTEDTLVETEVS